jgi:hypothetical protein
MKHAAALLTLALIAAFPNGSHADCADCVAPRRQYDSQEVIRTYQDVDQSRVINTTEVRTRVVMPVPVIKTIEIVVQPYRVVEVPNYAYVPVRSRPVVESRCGRYGHQGWCGPPLRVRN